MVVRARTRHGSRPARRRLPFALVTSLLSTAAAGVQAQPTEMPAAPAAPQLSLEEIAVMLASSDADEVRRAIEASALLGSPEVVPFLAERIRAGLPGELLEAAVDAVAMVNAPDSRELLVMLSRHRRASVRMRAVQALAAAESKANEEVLVQALGDASGDVRSAAMEGLGKLPGGSNVDALFAAFQAGIPGSGAALGKRVSDGQLPRLLESLGRLPLTTLTPVFDALLARRDLGEASKLTIVTALAELGTPEARGYLERLAQTLPPGSSPRLRKAIEEAVARIGR